MAKNKGWTHGKDIHNANGKAIRHSLSAQGIKNKPVTNLHKTMNPAQQLNNLNKNQTIYSIQADFGRPYEIIAHGKEELFKELKRLKKEASGGKFAYNDVYVIDADDNDVTDEVFSEIETGVDTVKSWRWSKVTTKRGAKAIFGKKHKKK